ncbi:MAG: dTDP-4-dehydrorhamnose 3 5-epimerase [bacterium]|nr:MAG: dTDP-4-dehydrorhamnose 3 5-epimerase [bacterium]
MAILVTKLALPEVLLIEPNVFRDSRGFFLEAYNQKEFAQNGIDIQFVQDNFSHSIKGVLRGLHYQALPMAQGKLVRCVRGEVFDVAVDIRQGSPQFGKWVSVILSEENQHQLYIPPGFAHGFCVLSEQADVLYKATGFYAPHLDRGIVWNDPTIAINWPIKNPLVSDKDNKLLLLENAEDLFVY